MEYAAAFGGFLFLAVTRQSVATTPEYRVMFLFLYVCELTPPLGDTSALAPYNVPHWATLLQVSGVRG